jgi:hypothetical protein
VEVKENDSDVGGTSARLARVETMIARAGIMGERLVPIVFFSPVEYIVVTYSY